MSDIKKSMIENQGFNKNLNFPEADKLLDDAKTKIDQTIPNTKLEHELFVLEEQKDIFALQSWRTRIDALAQKAQVNKKSVKSEVGFDLAQAQQLGQKETKYERLKNFLGLTTLNAYELFVKKAQKQQALKSEKKSTLSPIDRLLRFNSSSGEDDTNQKLG